MVLLIIYSLHEMHNREFISIHFIKIAQQILMKFCTEAYSTQKKSRGGKSGESGGQGMGPPLPIQ
jgi:hypothetical protein